MNRIGTILIDNYPLGDLKIISTLIEFDYPILLHLKDGNNRDILFYLYDFEEDNFYYLSFIVKKITLAKYLKGAVSLKDIILDTSERDFFYLVKLSETVSYDILSFSNITEDILPSEDSYYAFDFPVGYSEYDDIYKEHDYVISLKNEALIFKMEPKDRRFSTTVGFEDAGEFITDINRSYKNYARQDFYEKFKLEITDSAVLNRTMNKVIRMADPRVVHLKYGSFEIGLTMDKIVDDNDINPEFVQWKNTILENYKKDVIEIDYEDEAQLNQLVQKYSVQLRREIFKPFLKTLSNRKYVVSVSDKKEKYFKSFKEPLDKSLKKILPDDEKLFVSLLPNRKLLNIVLEMNEGEDISKLRKKDLQTGMLFSKVVDSTSFELNKIDTPIIFIEFKKPLRFDVQFHDNVYIVQNDTFSISIKTDNKDDFEYLISANFFNILSKYSQEKMQNPKFKNDLIDENILHFIFGHEYDEDLPF
jgi:hypothetical protein